MDQERNYEKEDTEEDSNGQNTEGNDDEEARLFSSIWSKRTRGTNCSNPAMI